MNDGMSFLMENFSAVFLKTPDIIFSVMQKPFKKCALHMRVSRFLHIRKKTYFSKKTAVFFALNIFLLWKWEFQFIFLNENFL
jgi:hypothetical protein